MMKLECPSCHQKYRLTNQTIPAGTASVTCRKCTLPIPLKAASRGPGSKTVSTQPVSCGYCGRKVTVNALQATGSEQISCPSCQHPVVTAPQQAKPPAAPGPGFDAVHLTCGRCRQTYTLNRAKVPANAASATCKSCGNKIPIPGSLAKHHRPVRTVEGTQGGHDGLSAKPPEVLQDNEQVSMAADSATKRTWYRAFMALMLAALIGFGIWFGGGWLLDMFKTGWEVLIEQKPRPTMRTPSGTFSSKPLVAMRLNTPLVTHAIKGRISQNSGHRKSLAALNAVGLERVEVFMLPQSELLVVPALYIQGREIRHLEKLLAGYNLIEKAIHKAGSGKYVVDPAALGKKYGKNYPAIPYAIWFHKNTILIAPDILMEDPAVTLSRLMESPVSEFAGNLTSPKQAGTIAVQIPKTLESDWPAKLKQNPVLHADPRLAMTTGMGTSVLIQLGETLKAIDMIGAKLTVTGEERRRKFYFRPSFHAKSIAKMFNSQLEQADAQAASSQWLVREMLRLFRDRRIEYAFSLDGRDLEVRVEWLPEHDHLIMNALIRAMFGEVVEPTATSVARMAPSTGSVKTVKTIMPQFSLTADGAQLRNQIGRQIEANLFPAQYWDGKEPRMTVELDTLHFTNNALTKMTYEVLAVTSPDGRDLLRPSDRKDQHPLKPGEPTPGLVSINVRAGTAAEALATATVRFHLEVPTRLSQVEFTAADVPGSTRVAGKIPVRLARIEKDIADISFKDNPGIFMFAFDRAGNALAVNESMQMGNRITRRYHGVVHRLLVLVVEEKLTLPLETTVHLNGGMAYQLAHHPEKPAKTRYDNSPLKTYQNFEPAALDKLAVKWHEGTESEWFDRLTVDLPHGPFHGRTRWEANFFGRSEPVHLTGNRSNTDTQISFAFEKGALLKVHAAVGRVALDISTDIKRQPFVKTTERTPIIQKLPSDKIVTVIFDQNEVTLTPFDEDIVQIIAYDADMRRLRRDSFSQTKGLMRKFYYWGIPARVEVDIAGNHIKKTLAFDIVKRPVDTKAYKAFKQKLADQREVVTTLKQIAAARAQDRNRYGEDVAGLYYLYGRKQKAPLHLIEKDVAQSDPAGQQRFGYRLKPCKGYYFTVLDGIEVNDGHKPFPQEGKAHLVRWSKGSINTVRFKQLPSLAAIPADKSMPTFFEKSGRVFVKTLGGETLKYLPKSHTDQGWVEAGIVSLRDGSEAAR